MDPASDSCRGLVGLAFQSRLLPLLENCQAWDPASPEIMCVEIFCHCDIWKPLSEGVRGHSLLLIVPVLGVNSLLHRGRSPPPGRDAGMMIKSSPLVTRSFDVAFKRDKRETAPASERSPMTRESPYAHLGLFVNPPPPQSFTPPSPETSRAGHPNRADAGSLSEEPCSVTACFPRRESHAAISTPLASSLFRGVFFFLFFIS